MNPKSDNPSPTESAPQPANGGTPALPVRPAPEQPDRPAPDPTRYGDWEKNGRCIDF